jgi:hypothetical protein
MTKVLKRQGDILLERVGDPASQEFSEAEIVRDGVIARGEVTGHAHTVAGGTLVRRHGQTNVFAVEGTTVTHEEHADLELQMEYAGEGQMTGVYD